MLARPDRVPQDPFATLWTTGAVIRGVPDDRDRSLKAVDLGGEDEVVVGQALGRVGGERHRDPAPAELEVRVVTLAFGEQSDPRGEPEGVAEVAELEGPAQPPVALAGPGRVELPLQLGGAVVVQRRGAGRAGGAPARGQLRLAHAVRPPPKSRRKNAATAAHQCLSRPAMAVPARPYALIGWAARGGAGAARGGGAAAAAAPDGV